MWDKRGKQLFKSILTKHLLDAVRYEANVKYPLRNFSEPNDEWSQIRLLFTVPNPNFSQTKTDFLMCEEDQDILSFVEYTNLNFGNHFEFARTSSSSSVFLLFIQICKAHATEKSRAATTLPEVIDPCCCAFTI